MFHTFVSLAYAIEQACVCACVKSRACVPVLHARAPVARYSNYFVDLTRAIARRASVKFMFSFMTRERARVCERARAGERAETNGRAISVRRLTNRSARWFRA